MVRRLRGVASTSGGLGLGPPACGTVVCNGSLARRCMLVGVLGAVSYDALVHGGLGWFWLVSCPAREGRAEGGDAGSRGGMWSDSVHRHSC